MHCASTDSNSSPSPVPWYRGAPTSPKPLSQQNRMCLARVCGSAAGSAELAPPHSRAFQFSILQLGLACCTTLCGTQTLARSALAGCAPRRTARALVQHRFDHLLLADEALGLQAIEHRIQVLALLHMGPSLRCNSARECSAGSASAARDP